MATHARVIVIGGGVVGCSVLYHLTKAGGDLGLRLFGRADVIADEPIWRDGEVVGWVTSGGYAHYTGHSVALGYVYAAARDTAAAYEIEIIGERRPSQVPTEALYDPGTEQIRS